MLLALACSDAVVSAATGDTTLASVTAGGLKGDGDSEFPSVSADGMRVAFQSIAGNLAPGGSGGVRQIYAKDLRTGEVWLVSSTQAGSRGSGNSSRPSISADGNRVAFVSEATNLHPGDTQADPDIYVKVLGTGELHLASISAGGQKGNNFSFTPSLSEDGTRVAFASLSTNLVVPGETDIVVDVYVKDLGSGEIWLASTASDGSTKGNGASSNPSISADGSVVAFQSLAANLDPTDTDSTSDVYVKDLRDGSLTLASASSAGQKGDGGSVLASLSGAGTRVAFRSAATNLDPDDPDAGPDIYVKDLANDELSLASRSTTDTRGDRGSDTPTLSHDGNRVAFVSSATNLSPMDGDDHQDVFVRNLVTWETVLASSASDGSKGNGTSWQAHLSADGARVAFASIATNLDPIDDEMTWDVYVKELEASSSPLALGPPGATFSLDAAQPTRLFALTAPEGESLVLTLEDADVEDENALYARWGQAPDSSTFDHAADRRGRAAQRLVISSARATTCYVLVRANVIRDGSNEVTLMARVARLELEEMSADSAGLGEPHELHAAVLGSAFDIDTVFELVPQGGGVAILGRDALLVSESRVELVFDLADAVAGAHILWASSPSLGQTVALEEPFTVNPTAHGPELEAGLVEVREGVHKYRYDRPSRLTLRYRNTGDGEMTAPLFKIVAPPDTELRAAREEAFQDGELHVLGIHPNGVPGKLPPGAGWEIPIEFRSKACAPGQGTCAGHEFQLFVLTPLPDDHVEWDRIDPSATGLSPATWPVAWPALSVNLGATWREYHEAVAALATRLSRRGATAWSVRELYRFAVREALGRPSAAIVGSVRLPGGRVPVAGQEVVALESGLVWSRGATDEQGSFALDWLVPGKSYEIALPSCRVTELRVPGVAGSGTTVRLPSQGDVLGVVVNAVREETDYDSECRGCDESDLPESPLRPPESVFSLVGGLPAEIVSSWDPNEKTGPEGGSTTDRDRLVPPEARLDYTIFFENKAGAGAPAQEVVVRDFLDPNLFDLSTLRLRDVQVGKRPDQRLVLDMLGRGLESGYTSQLSVERYSAIAELPVQVSEGGRVPVQLETRLERVLRDSGDGEVEMVQITWHFTTLTDDDLVGFLPRNCVEDCPDCESVPDGEDGCKDGRGEAHVSFSVQAMPGLAKDTVLVNEATVEFDKVPVPPDDEDSLRWENVVWDRLLPEVPHTPEPQSGSESIGGETAFSGQVSLSWEAGGSATYDVSLWREVQPADLVIDRKGLTERSLSWAGLEPRTAYRWRVRAVNEHGYVDGPEWRFATGPVLLDPPSPVSPQPPDGAVDIGESPRLAWELSAAWDDVPLHYRVLLWKAGEPRRTIAAGAVRTEFEVAAPLEPGATYHWMVVAFHADGATGSPEPPWTFTVAMRRFVRGDVDANSRVEITDAINILNYLFFGGIEPSCLEAADVNDDDNLERPDLSDPIYLLNWLFIGGPKPPEPAECGIDPKEQGLGCRSFPPCE